MISAVNTVLKLTKSFINLLYPLHCASCGKHLESVNEHGVCDFCQAQIKRNPRPYCRSCGRSMQGPGAHCQECRKTLPLFSRAYSACLYEGPLKELIHKFKYKNRRILSGIFTKIMLDFIRDTPDVIEGIDLITFVGLHRKRENERGFNQSEMLASDIGKELDIRVMGLLEKTLATKNQNELSREDRLVNIRGAFRVRPAIKDVIRGATVLIIDDVMTTGATLNESCRALLSAGVTHARCLTLARGI